MKVIKYILIGLGVIFGIYLGNGFLAGFNSNFVPDELVNKAKQQKSSTQTFTSGKGFFTIDLPSNMKMFERPERLDGGITSGEVWFTFGQFDENAPSGLVVVYGKPGIDGKGGACVDEKGEGGYKKEIISGQEVEVCKIEGFKAEYFTHPSKKIEYQVSTARVSREQTRIISEAIRKTFRFE